MCNGQQSSAVGGFSAGASSQLVGLLCALLIGPSLSGATDETTLARSTRTLPFLQGSGNGYIFAVALPLALGRRHVFTAFNFEIHYGLADNNTFSPTILKNRWEGKRSVDETPPLQLTDIPADRTTDHGDDAKKKKPAPKRKSKNRMTRKNVYRAIENQLFESGFNGTACLLKTICNTAESDLYENNGVFGNLFHIVFTPSSSKDEGLPQFFYDAEQMGHFRQCDDFHADCPKSLLELASNGFIEWFQ